jgi:hypothetical protein
MNDFMKNYSWDYKAINLNKELAKWGVGKEDEIKSESTSESINKLVAKEKLNNEELVYYENLIADKLTIGKFTASNDLINSVDTLNKGVINASRLGFNTPEKLSAFIDSVENNMGWDSVRPDDKGGAYGPNARDGGSKGHFGRDVNYISLNQAQKYGIPIASMGYGEIVNLDVKMSNGLSRIEVVYYDKTTNTNNLISDGAKYNYNSGFLLKEFPDYLNNGIANTAIFYIDSSNTNLKKGDKIEPGQYIGNSQDLSINSDYSKTPQHNHLQVGLPVKTINNDNKIINSFQPVDPFSQYNVIRGQQNIKNAHKDLFKGVNNLKLVMPNFLSKPVHKDKIR